MAAHILPSPLTPLTTKHLIESFAHLDESCPSDTGSGSASPDSLYSETSPRVFDFDPDQDQDEEAEITQHDEAEYESLADGDEWASPAWGAWPEMGPRSWSRAGSLGGSLISLSPRGSAAGSTAGSRKGSLVASMSASGRGSASSLLGFGLNARQLTALGAGPRRRSSAMSNTSLETRRLRHMASMDGLERRFSEVVEVAVPSPTHASIARRAMDQSQWSPGSSSVGDESEIHTAPYVPTPPAPRGLPGMLSNFPLSTAVSMDGPEEDSASDASFSPPRVRRRLPLPLPPVNLFATPPPPAQPSTLLRERSRPSLKRAMTEYQFPPRGQPTGASAPRPILARSKSTSFFAAPDHARQALEARARGTFPLHRAAPLGVSPLRESLRRASFASEGAAAGAARRESAPSPRRLSIPDRRRKEDLRRASIDRRMSEASRRSSDTRAPFDIAMRRVSTSDGRAGTGSSRQSSLSIGTALRMGSMMSASATSPVSGSPRRGSSRKGSYPSRKGSVMSMAEYDYLAPQIVIDAASPIAEQDPIVPGISLGAMLMLEPESDIEAGAEPESAPRHSLPNISRLRRAAPPSIVLPPYTFPSPTSPSSATPRYNPLDSFFGRLTPSAHTPTPDLEVDPLTPATSALSTPRGYAGPAAGMGVMDRPRPISPPEFENDGFMPRFKGPHPVSPTAMSPVPAPEAATVQEVAIVATTPAVEVALVSIPAALPAAPVLESFKAEFEVEVQAPGLIPSPERVVVRKAVPHLSDIELREEEAKDRVLRARKSAEILLGPMMAAALPLAPAPVLISESVSPSPQRGEDRARRGAIVGMSPHSPHMHASKRLRPAHSRAASTVSAVPPPLPRFDSSPRPAHRRMATADRIERIDESKALAEGHGGMHMPNRYGPLSSQAHGHAPAPTSGSPHSPRRSHVVFDVPTWGRPSMPDSSPELLASVTIASILHKDIPGTPASTYAPASPGPHPHPHPLRPSVQAHRYESERVISKRASVTFAPRPVSATMALALDGPAPGPAAARPSMPRASSFSRFFHKAKAASISISSPSQSHVPAQTRSPLVSGLGVRPISLDGALGQGKGH